MISALIFFPIATCDQENILINKVLLRSKSEKNMENNSISNIHNTIYHHDPLIFTRDIRFPGLHTTRFKTSRTRFSLSLHWGRGRKVESTSLLHTVWSTQMSYRNKTALLPTLKALWLPKINGMQENRRLSSDRQPVAFNFPSDRKTECCVRLCLLCVKTCGQGIWVNDSTCSKFLFVIHSLQNNHKK